MEFKDIYALLEQWKAKVRKFIKWQLEPAVFVGNKERVRKMNEGDSDAEHLAMVNRTWREMLHDDVGWQRLVKWVNFFKVFVLLFSLLFFCFENYAIARTCSIFAAAGVLIFGFLWLGPWNKKIEDRVWTEVFEKKFGKGRYHRH